MAPFKKQFKKWSILKSRGDDKVKEREQLRNFEKYGAEAKEFLDQILKQHSEVDRRLRNIQQEVDAGGCKSGGKWMSKCVEFQYEFDPNPWKDTLRGFCKLEHDFSKFEAADLEDFKTEIQNATGIPAKYVQVLTTKDGSVEIFWILTGVALICLTVLWGIGFCIQSYRHGYNGRCCGDLVINILPQFA